MRYTNNSNVSLSMAVWLANDEYNHHDDPKTISATTLIRPVKQTVLAARVPQDEGAVDLTTLVKSRSGTAIHNAVESAWKNNYKESMAALGYPQSVIDRVVVNPSQSDLDSIENPIPVYLEQRAYKMVDGYTVTGQFDFCAEGGLEDVKTTSTYTYIMKSNDREYQLQGSIYRWLMPDIITKDHMLIQYVFTDWTPMGIKRDKNYPPSPQLAYKVPLMSYHETESFVKNRIHKLKVAWDLPEQQLEPCTDEELWRSPPIWKYYKNPAKMSRSTKNFDNATEAFTRCAEDGNTGTVVEVPGEVRACKYCPAFPICTQKDGYLADGSLKI